MEKKKDRVTIPILFTILVIVAVILTIRTCNKKPDGDPATSRLEQLNDSLFKELKHNNLMIDSLHGKLDSLNTLTDTLLKLQPIINEYYTQEVYNILSDDAKRSNSRLSETLKFSDSLLKAGFYTRTIKLPNSTY
jgi:uncharacterized alpha/beta hydrolase family protein